MPKNSTQHPTEWFVRSTWANKFFFQKLPSVFPLEHVESSFDFYTEFSLANSRNFSLKVREFLSNHKPVANFPQRLTLDTSNAVLTNLLWIYGQKNEHFLIGKREKIKTSNFTNEYLYKKHENVLRICLRACKYKFLHLTRNFSAICRRSFSWKCKNHIEFKLLSETSFPHHILLETRMHFWQPAEKFFVKFQKENEIEKFQTHSSCLSGQQQSVMFWQTCRKFSRKIPKFYCSQCKKLISKFYEKIKCLRNVPLDW